MLLLLLRLLLLSLTLSLAGIKPTNLIYTKKHSPLSKKHRGCVSRFFRDLEH